MFRIFQLIGIYNIYIYFIYKEKFLCAIENETKVKQIACQRVLSIISSCSESIIHFFRYG